MKIVLALLMLITNATAETVDLTPVKKWVEHTAGLKTFRASFTQLRFLRTVRKPLESAGIIMFAAPGSIRWEAGAPVNMIATVKSGGSLTIQHPDKKEAEVITRAMLEEKSDGQALALVESGFPQSFAEFQKKFEVTGISKVGEVWQVEAKLAGSSGGAVRKLVFLIQDGAFTLNGLQFFFRDGSRVESTFTKFTENGALPKDCFVPDLKGYQMK